MFGLPACAGAGSADTTKLEASSEMTAKAQKVQGGTTFIWDKFFGSGLVTLGGEAIIQVIR